MSGCFSSEEKDNMFLEGAGVRVDQEQKLSGHSGSQVAPWSWNTWRVVGAQGEVYENRQGKIQAVKDLVCPKEGAGSYPTDHVRPSEAL